MAVRKEANDYQDRIGERHGKLVIVEIVGRDKTDRMIAKCKCDCGNYHYAQLHSVICDKLGSCGCSRRNYKGLCLRTQERLYKIYYGMKSRCNNPNMIGYHNYGGRGIRVCEEWLNDYKAFREWALANGYSDNLTLDRIDVNGDYTPDNCRWATWIEQCNNKRDNICVTYNGETHTLTEWSRITGIKAQVLLTRYKKGFALDVVFSPNRLASRGHYEKRKDIDSNSNVAKAV